jgi:hypothetical protein
VSPGPWGPNTVAGAEDIVYGRITGSNQLAQYLGIQQATGIGSMLVPNSVQPVLVVNGETATPNKINNIDFIHSGGHVFTSPTKGGFEFIPGDPTGLGNIALAALTFWASSLAPFPISQLFTTENAIDPEGIIVVHDIQVSSDAQSDNPTNVYCGLVESGGTAPTIVIQNTIAADKISITGFEGSAQLILGEIPGAGPPGGINETPNASSTTWISNAAPGLMYQRARALWKPFESVTPFVLPLNRKIVGGQTETGGGGSAGIGVSVLWQQIPINNPL